MSDVKNPQPAALVGMGFQKGVSGNPGGRARGVERETRDEIAKFKIADPEHGEINGWRALRLRLFRIAMGVNGASDRDAIAAIKLLHERGYGMPKQNVKIDDGHAATSDVDWSSLPLEQRRAMLAGYVALGLTGAPIGSDEPTEH